MIGRAISKTLWFLILVTALPVGNVAGAADMLDRELANGSGFIAVIGKLKLGDEKKFNLIAQKYSKAAVVFSSPGGNLFAGIEIGQIIRMRNFGTGVAPGTMCASACALAWLGGTKRYVASTSRVGFHAAFVVDDGIARETGLGNAMLGAYLTQLGLPMSAVIYISHKPPNDVQWLSAYDARKVGIDVEVLEVDGTPSTLSAVAPDPKTSSPVPLKSGDQWLVVASRSALSDAVEIAEKYKSEFPETRIFLSSNGQYAVSLGRFANDRSMLEGLKENGRIPADSYFSKGAKLTSRVWP